MPLKNSPVPWTMPQAFVDALSAHPLKVTPTNRTFAPPPGDGPVQPGQVVQYASIPALQRDIAAGKLAPGTWVMYDIEPWDLTPASEYAAPYRSIGEFVDLAHAAKLRVIVVPAGGLDQVRAAKQGADVFQPQIQSITDPKAYGAICKQLAAVLGPHQGLVAELSTGRTSNVAQMMKQWLAARQYVSGFSLWYGGDTAGTFAAQAARATAFLNRAAAYQADHPMPSDAPLAAPPTAPGPALRTLTVGSALTAVHHRQQLAVRSQTVRDATRLWATWKPGDEASWRRMVDLAQPVVASRHRISASAASRYFEAKAVLDTGQHDVAIVAAPLVEERVAASLAATGLVGTIAAKSRGFSMQAAAQIGFVRFSGALSRLALEGGRETIVASAVQSARSQGWQRVTGDSPCEFCSGLAEEFVGADNEAISFAAHDHCACSAEPVFA